jgi:hypothetical protein
MARIQKMILLGISLPVALYPTFAILLSIFKNHGRFHYSMMIGFALTIVGIVSFIFHLKSLKVYSLYKKDKVLPVIEPIFWWLNLVFALACILFAALMTYMAYEAFYGDMLWRLLVVIIPTIILGFWMLIDAFLLNSIYRIHQHNNRYSEIDEIKGK